MYSKTIYSYSIDRYKGGFLCSVPSNDPFLIFVKANEDSEAAKESENKLGLLEGLCKELKSRLVESIAQSEGQDEQLSHLKVALNAALEKIKILQKQKGNQAHEVCNVNLSAVEFYLHQFTHFP